MDTKAVTQAVNDRTNQLVSYHLKEVQTLNARISEIENAHSIEKAKLWKYVRKIESELKMA